MKHLESSALINANPQEVFNFVDDHQKFSSHMGQSSLVMGGGSMKTELDDKKGQIVGSHIKLNGKVFGIDLYLDEVVIKRVPPHLKEWETVGTPKLLIIGYYKMKIEIKPQDLKSLVRVSIDYELPEKNAWLGKLFSTFYAKWCVSQMLKSTVNHFV